MFQELRNQIWSASDTDKVFIDDISHFTIDGDAKSVMFGLQSKNEWAEVAFDEIDFNDFEELVFHIYYQAKLGPPPVFKLTIGGKEYFFDKPSSSRDYSFIIIDASGLGKVSSMRITSLMESTVIFIDVLGARKTDYSCMDTDLIHALKNHIALDYEVETSLEADVPVGAKQISLKSMAYIFDTTMLQLEEGGIKENVALVDAVGHLRKPLENAFTASAIVRALCPTVTEEETERQYDPICGIAVYDMSTSKEDVMIYTKTGQKRKRFLGRLGIHIYIDCVSKQKVIQLTRQYQQKYGERFIFLLDGERIELRCESTIFIDNEIGNNPRKSFFYRCDPQPVLVKFQNDFNISDTLKCNIDGGIRGTQVITVQI